MTNYFSSWLLDDAYFSSPLSMRAQQLVNYVSKFFLMCMRSTVSISDAKLSQLFLCSSKNSINSGNLISNKADNACKHNSAF